jgi:hypothetical protein
LIVGASPWTIALAKVLRSTGVPTLITDPDFQALRPARKDGLRTLRIEILSGVGEELIDLRGIEYLLAATGDDAYNALVCTRFAPDLGRERVHQPAFSVESGEGLATSREWRGKIAIHDDLHHGRLVELTKAGYVFKVSQVEEAGVLPSGSGVEGWPVLSVGAGGALSFFSPEQDLTVSAGDKIVSFQAAPPSSEARGRKRRLRALKSAQA